MIRISIIISILIINTIIYNKIIYISILILGYLIKKYIKILYNDNNLGYYLITDNKLDKLGYLGIILTEIIIFTTLIGIYIYYAIKPNIEYNCIWIPKGIEKIDEINIPLLNTLILLSSGLTLTISHYIIKNKYKYIEITLRLILIFLILQYIEYYTLPLDLTSSLFSNLFFLITGFHRYTYGISLYMNI